MTVEGGGIVFPKSGQMAQDVLEQLPDPRPLWPDAAGPRLLDSGLSQTITPRSAKSRGKLPVFDRDDRPAAGSCRLTPEAPARCQQSMPSVILLQLHQRRDLGTGSLHFGQRDGNVIPELQPRLQCG